MQQTKTLKFFTFVRYSTGKLINFISQDKQQEGQYQQEATKIVQRLLESKLQPKERQKVNSQFGNWFATPDEKDLLYLVLTTQDYSERNAYGLIKNFKEQLDKMGDYSNEDDLSLKYNTRAPMKELFLKYSDPSQFDKISQAQNEVGKVKDIMTDNISQVLKNQENLKQVDTKALHLNKQSQKFVKQAKDLERIMFWRKVKLNIIIALIIIAVGCFIILPIVLETDSISETVKSKTSDDKDKNKESTEIAVEDSQQEQQHTYQKTSSTQKSRQPQQQKIKQEQQQQNSQINNEQENEQEEDSGNGNFLSK